MKDTKRGRGETEVRLSGKRRGREGQCRQRKRRRELKQANKGSYRGRRKKLGRKDTKN